MVIGSLADVSFIARSDLAGWPLIGKLSRLQRTVFVARDRKAGSMEQAGDIARRLAGNDAVVLFAEGTTGDGNQLLPFKSALFGAVRLVLDEVNVETVYVQPIAISLYAPAWHAHGASASEACLLDWRQRSFTSLQRRAAGGRDGRRGRVR